MIFALTAVAIDVAFLVHRAHERRERREHARALAHLRTYCDLCDAKWGVLLGRGAASTK